MSLKYNKLKKKPRNIFSL